MILYSGLSTRMRSQCGLVTIAKVVNLRQGIQPGTHTQSVLHSARSGPLLRFGTSASVSLRGYDEEAAIRH
jgi:hypothetical protein